MDKEALEKIAELAHLTWQRWMAYMLVRLEDMYSIARWKRQANTAYRNLPEPEKESDRAVALRYIALFEELGYRKPPEGQPPLLSEEEMQNIRFNKPSSNAPRIPSYVTVIAQAQREADIKWYGGKR